MPGRGYFGLFAGATGAHRCSHRHLNLPVVSYLRAQLILQLDGTRL